MPGYVIHLASINSNFTLNKSFTLGVEAPDILKKHLKLYGLEGARDKYNALKTSDMPPYEELVERIQEKEVLNDITGLHFGVSSILI